MNLRKKVLKRRNIIIFIAAFLCAAVSIVTGKTVLAEETDVNVLEPSLITEEIYMSKGSSKTLEINNLQEDAIVSYLVADTGIVEVTENGVVNAIAVGNTEIAIDIQQGGKEYSLSVTIVVWDELGSFSIKYISGNSLTLAKKQTRTLYYSISPSELTDMAKEYIVWTSDNEAVASVSKDGKITAKSEGKANITLSTINGCVEPITIKVTVTKRKKGDSYTEKNMTIVNTSKAKYTYTEMVSDLKALEKKYGDCIKVSILADTYDKRHIYQVILGNPNAKKKVMVQAAIHAREYMTSQLTMKQIEFYCRNYYTGRYKSEYFSELFNDVALYIVPMANPDGVTISQYGPSGIKNKTLREKIIKICKQYGKGKYSFYSTWKSNARGVNLNLNFDANWKITKGSKTAHGNKGSKAVSELESKALVNLFNKIKPVKTISYHATGSILYWYYGQTGELKKTSLQMANAIKSMTSYSLINSFNKKHAAGFSDWVSIKKKTCAVTIEIGKKPCPLKINEFPSIWSKNKLIYALYAKST